MRQRRLVPVGFGFQRRTDQLNELIRRHLRVVVVAHHDGGDIFASGHTIEFDHFKTGGMMGEQKGQRLPKFGAALGAESAHRNLKGHGASSFRASACAHHTEGLIDRSNNRLNSSTARSVILWVGESCGFALIALSVPRLSILCNTRAKQNMMV